MKKISLAGILILLTLSLAEAAQAAWLLWKHSWVTCRVEGKPRGLSAEGDVDKWELLNAVDLRNECVATLRVEHRKTLDSLIAVYPKEPVEQSIVADGISASVSTGAEKSGGASARATQLYYEYTFWCLPAGVDPKITRSVPGRK